MAEQPDQGSESSIIERLTALDAPPEAAAAPEAADDSAPAVAQEVADEDSPDLVADEPQEPSAEADLTEIQHEDGNVYKIPAPLKDSFLRWQDYTKKTQETSKLQEAAQDRLHFAEAREQLVGTLLQDVAERHAIETQLKSYENVDWGALYNSDPGQAMRLRDQRDQLQSTLRDKTQQIAAKAQHFQAQLDQHSGKQWALAVEGVKARIGSYSQEEDAAMAKAVSELGFTDKELKGRFADPRFLHAIYKAAKYDMLQKAKPGAVAAVSKAPPIVKPGASQGQQAQRESAYKQTRAALRKSGSVEDAAKLFLMRGK